MGERVLITGIGGFLGRHLASALKAEGVRVAGIARRPSPAVPADELHVGDIADRRFVSGVLASVRPSVVFHLAADKTRTERPEDFRRGLEVNVLGTLNLAEACLGQPFLERFVAMGTCEEYGRATVPFAESAREQPVSAYSFSKAATTHLLQTLHRTHEFPVVVLRPSLAYGPGQGTDMFLPALIEALLSGRRFHMSQGEQTRDYVFMDDLIAAIILAGRRREAVGEILNISSGERVVLRDLARMTARKIGPDAEARLDIGARPYRPAEVMDYVASYARAKELLGWSPGTSLDVGITRTIDHYRERGFPA